MVGIAVGFIVAVVGCKRSPSLDFASIPELSPGVGYTNQRISGEPWSIHIVRMDRSRPDLAIHSAHARDGTPGLTRLTRQLRKLPATIGTPVAAINGDFYQRDFDHAGDPRGLQIADGELFSAPNGGVAFWVDAQGQLHATNVTARFQVTWPNNEKSSFGLNEDRHSDALVLYTPSLGNSTRTAGGREFVLEPIRNGAGQPLSVGESFSARVHEVRNEGDTKLQANRLVLSAGPSLKKSLPPIREGDVLEFSTATSPDLHGAVTAIGGGPILVRNGQVMKIRPHFDESYEFSSMSERHPRSALGWDSAYLYLVTVDGRQDRLSVGMTLGELAETFLALGCTDAMTLDGGGSATLWFAGKIRNSPCDGEERPIANALVVTRKP